MSRNTRTNNKYSYNVKSFMEALWVYECFLLLLDKPIELYTIILNGKIHTMTQYYVYLLTCLIGNYHTIVSTNLVSNEIEYYHSLGCWIKTFVVLYNIFNETDADTLIKVYDNIMSTKLYGFKISALSSVDRSCINFDHPASCNNYFITYINDNRNVLERKK